MGFLRDLFGPRQPCELCQLGNAHWPQDRAASADWKLRTEGLDVSLFICVPCRTLILKHGITHPLVAITSFIVRGHATHPAPHVYLQNEAWRKIWMHAFAFASVTPADEFQAIAIIQRIEGEFFDDIIAGREHDRKYRPVTGPEISRKIRESYRRHRESARQRGAAGASSDLSVAYPPALVGAFASYYLPNVAHSTDEGASYVLKHVLPFLGLAEDVAVEALGAYVTWREGARFDRVDWLAEQVYRGYLRVSQTELLSRFFGPKFNELAIQAYEERFDWAQLLDRWLDPNELDDRSEEVGISEEDSSDEEDLSDREVLTLIEKLRQAETIDPGSYPIPSEALDAAIRKWLQVAGDDQQSSEAFSHFVEGLHPKWILMWRSTERDSRAGPESEADLEWQYELKFGRPSSSEEKLRRDAWVAGHAELQRAFFASR
jgi:hypothetical protein